MGGCQNYGPLLGTLNIRCRIEDPKKAPEPESLNPQPYIAFAKRPSLAPGHLERRSREGDEGLQNSAPVPLFKIPFRV